MKSPEYYMRMALEEAQKAYDLNEVPIGAVIVKNDTIIGRGHNKIETSKDPTAHAEIIAIREATEALGGWRLSDCDLYVTTEPCFMCAGAIVLARISRLYIGTEDPKTGACVSLSHVTTDERLNHQVELTVGVLKDECRQLLKNFFRKLRK
ncbi:MAG: nucleoside deaminase [Clostridia bacterium]|nr:nucleoside deaminase [Clostridia bacterium]